MTREEWAAWVEASAFLTSVQRTEFAALLREHAWLTDSELDTLRKCLATEEISTSMWSEINNIIARHTPAPPIQWTEVGANSTAVVNSWSLLVRHLERGYDYIITSPAGKTFGLSGWFDTPDRAKTACEKHLRELAK